MFRICKAIIEGGAPGKVHMGRADARAIADLDCEGQSAVVIRASLFVAFLFDEYVPHPVIGPNEKCQAAVRAVRFDGPEEDLLGVGEATEAKEHKPKIVIDLRVFGGEAELLGESPGARVVGLRGLVVTPEVVHGAEVRQRLDESPGIAPLGREGFLPPMLNLGVVITSGACKTYAYEPNRLGKLRRQARRLFRQRYRVIIFTPQKGLLREHEFLAGIGTGCLDTPFQRVTNAEKSSHIIK